MAIKESLRGCIITLHVDKAASDPYKYRWDVDIGGLGRVFAYTKTGKFSDALKTANHINNISELSKEFGWSKSTLKVIGYELVKQFKAV